MYGCRKMKAQKNLSLSVEVVERLNEVENQTKLVEGLLRDHFDMESRNNE